MSDLRAPAQSKALSKNKVHQDTRTMGEKISDTVPKWDMSIILIFGISLIPFAYPITLWIVLPAIFIIARISGKSDVNRTLPFKLPMMLSDQQDINAPKPGQKGKYYNGQGTILLGNLRTDNTEVWMTGKDMLTHMLLIGTTGAGKTETLVSLSSCTAFCMGGGTIYVDAKAAPKLVYQFATLARIFGREDDMRVISFITGDSGSKIRHWERLSNTTNPFSQGSANNAVQTLSALLPPGGGDNQFFLDRAISLLTALMPALVELRDKGVVNIYPSLIGDFISLKKFMELSRNEIIINDIEYDVELTPPTLMIIKAFLKALPGFDPTKPPEKQGEQVHNQFGFAEGYFAKTLASLSGTYGHIYQTELAEADFVDIVMHNRILIVLVPAMGLAPSERSVLGKIILSCIRAAMGRGLGDKGEGNIDDVLEALPVDLKIPTIIIVDEYAEVAVEGFAVTATQGRGLGMSVVFAGQDLAGFQKASEEESDMIFGNTRLKILMALEDPDITMRKFRELAGKMSVSKSAGHEANKDGLTSYKKNMSASIEEVERINFLDLKEQREGQAHVFEQSNIHITQLFHHGIFDDKLVKNWRINRMLKVLSPKPDIVRMLQSRIERNINIDNVIEGELVPEPISTELKDTLEKFSGPKDSVSWPWDMLLKIKADNEPEKTSAPVDIKTAKPVPTVQTQPIPAVQHPESKSLNDNSKTDSGVSSNEMDDMLGYDSQTDTGVSSDEMDDMLGNDSQKDSGVSSDEMDDMLGEAPIEKASNINTQNATPDVVPAATTTEHQSNSDSPLSKVENHWVFNNITDAEGIAKSERLLAQVKEMNALAGQSNDAASKAAENSVITVAESLLYPSSAIESKENDVEDLWAILNNNDDE
jgi:intracellular multiplication protein IcmO